MRDVVVPAPGPGRRRGPPRGRLSALPLVLLLVLAACGEREVGEAERDRLPSPEEVRLVEALASPDATVRVNAARGLHALEPPPVGAMDALVVAVEDENRWVREWAIRTLVRLGPDAAPAVDALTRALVDRDSFVRWRAAQALAAIGPAAAAAIEELERAASTTKETEVGRWWAREALRRIRGGEPALEPPGR